MTSSEKSCWIIVFLFFSCVASFIFFPLKPFSKVKLQFYIGIIIIFMDCIMGAAA